MELNNKFVASFIFNMSFGGEKEASWGYKRTNQHMSAHGSIYPLGLWGL